MAIFTGGRIHPNNSITSLSVSGYKCIRKRKSIFVKPLTILAGANSSGKSSMLQPLLLLKQTVESGYDPGPLGIDGPNVKFSDYNQLFSNANGRGKGSNLKIEIGISDDRSFGVYYKLIDKKRLKLDKIILKNLHDDGRLITLSPGMRHKSIMRNLPKSYNKAFYKQYNAAKEGIRWSIVTEEKFFLTTSLKIRERNKTKFVQKLAFTNMGLLASIVASTIHVPAFRGNAERSYPTTYRENYFPGTFDKYVAGIISSWEINMEKKKLRSLFASLQKLGLADRIFTKKVSDVQVELYVSQSKFKDKKKSISDISIADVGFGVSQVLPVLVSLLVSEEGQIVFIEQPEIHIHPFAINKLAELIADAANRGVKVVIETHSQILIKSIQTLIANNYISSDKTIIHWFSKDILIGDTKIYSKVPDENGAYGNLPIDLDDVYLFAESNYWKSAVKLK